MIDRALNHLEEWIITFLMGAATVLIFSSFGGGSAAASL